MQGPQLVRAFVPCVVDLQGRGRLGGGQLVSSREADGRGRWGRLWHLCTGIVGAEEDKDWRHRKVNIYNSSHIGYNGYNIQMNG